MANILITGAGTGLGRGAALGLARAGHHVVAGAEIWSQVRDLRAEAQRQEVTLEAVKLDVTDDLDRRHAFGHDVDILVLNAGIQEAGAVVEIPMERVRRSFEVNVFGHLHLVQGFAPQLLRRGSGKVVWVSSAAGIRTRPWLGVYAATKHAIEALAWAMKNEMEPRGIRVAVINPGPFRTGYNDTGVEAMYQWWEPATALLDPPDFRDYLDNQYDPQEMVDAMVEVIPADHHPYRTVRPAASLQQDKDFESRVWAAGT
ncbi:MULTISPECIES: SDR family oxidoreductase [Micromonospora]|uniref:Short-chain dehydrogenase n=1 Tax=Micromonospora sicca TaxID=2202420 RepID=A0A317DJX2_9ACTN|nr:MULTISPECIES: SDR family oxidoreductase [unclassified Micromonospora]MBM0224146.1 SDR family oxidoreductase [Micromonospora sp. ATA51]PWR14654.1 short-chain dehydrogenase [Micromonospora sp. 4G51]